MTKSTDDWIKLLRENETLQTQKLNDIVAESLKEERLLTHKLHRDSAIEATFGQRIADRIASFGGSWTFIISFMVFFALWVIANTMGWPEKTFDPYPFILLNLFLSLIAALQAPLILMSQNRQEAKDRKRSEQDYLINLKSELEIRALHQKIDSLLIEQFKTLLDTQNRQMQILCELVEGKDKN
jgi:uncharacterized membrane protein